MDGEGGRWPSIFHIPFSIQLFSYRGGAGNRKPARNLCIEIRERRQRVYRQLVRVSREPPTDPDNHLNDNCRQRGINCRPRNKLHVPVTASILVTRPPIAALAALPLSHPPPTRNSQLRFHHYVKHNDDDDNNNSVPRILLPEESSSTNHRSFSSSIVPLLSIRTPPR